MKREAKTETKTYILELKDGNIRKITIPATWKLTYGHLVPHSERGRSDGGVALRLYEGNKENLRAVMTDVRSLRDASIEMIEKRTSVKRQAAQKQTPKGMKDVVIEARMTEWVNPDKEEDEEIPSDFLALPEPEDDE